MAPSTIIKIFVIISMRFFFQKLIDEQHYSFDSKKKKVRTACSKCESEISKASPSSALVQYEISLKEIQ